MNRFARGLLTGGLLSLAAVGTAMAMTRRRQRQMMMMRSSRMFRHRARRTMGMMRNGAYRVGSAIKSGTAAFAERIAQR